MAWELATLFVQNQMAIFVAHSLAGIMICFTVLK